MSQDSSAPRRDGLGYVFDPLPGRVRHALREGALDRDDYVILGVLYGRADRDLTDLRDERGRRYFPARATLEQLAEDLRWTTDATRAAPRRRKLAALSKRLQRLSKHPEQWLAYATRRGPGARYDFRLYPDAPELSEIGPKFESTASPNLDGAQAGTEGGLASASKPPVSEIREHASVRFGPKPRSRGPKFEEAAEPRGERDSAASRERAGPNPPESQEKDLSSKGAVGSSAPSRAREGEPSAEKFIALLDSAASSEEPVFRAEPADEDRVVAEFEEAVRSGVLVRRRPPCRQAAYRRRKAEG